MTAFAHSFNSMQVTISLLPVSLSLVHIPRSRLPQLSHPVLKQILQPSPTFLNITCNEIELSLFAEHRVLADFELIARDDRRRQRSRSGSGSSRKNVSRSFVEPVEISYERWNVLQIDSHADQLDNAGARVHELSAPLAEAGISILYQSSYMSDFIMVKESRLQEVMGLLGSTGFDLYSLDPNLLTSKMVSPALSPVSADDFSSETDLGTNITTESGAVLTRTRSGTDTSMSNLASALQQSRVNSQTASTEETAQTTSTSSQTRSKSHSPTSGEVRVLMPDLACVGLSDDNVENWSLKILKLVAFPELIPAANISQSETTGPEDWYTGTYSVAGGQHPLFEPFTTISTPPDRGRREISPSSSSSSGEDGYFSHSPTGDNSNTSLSTSRSYPDLTKSSANIGPSFKPITKRLITPLLPIEPVADAPGLDSNETEGSKVPSSSRQSTVGFFSFTRTSEGSSLTTDVSLLASLFPPNERHMVICSGELDSVDKTTADDQIDEDDNDDENSDGILKCLQIDLRRFGLDKHGLVNRFSRVLEENGINHMYSSTFKTANLLVGKRCASRAQSLLRSC